MIERVMHTVAPSIAESLRFSLYYQGQKNLLDHMLISRRMMTSFVSAEIHNDMVHDESIAFATDNKFPESDNAPMVAEFDAVANAMMQYMPEALNDLVLALQARKLTPHSAMRGDPSVCNRRTSATRFCIPPES